MVYIVVTTDDLQPVTLPLFYKYWKPLKEKHPLLRLTAFISPYNKEFSQGPENNIPDNSEFKRWYEENKEWVCIELHGMTHEKPPENLRSEEEQERVVRESIFILRDYIDMDCIGYRPPFFRMNRTTTNILLRCGIKWYDNWYHISFIEPNKKPIPPHLVIPTHTSLEIGANPDNIDKIYYQLDKKLTELENVGYEYSSYREIVKGVM